MKSFAAIESKAFEMGLDCYSFALYARIVLHARNSKIGHIESQEQTAIFLNCSVRQIKISTKILSEKNMIKIEKNWRKNVISLIEPEFWISKSSAQSAPEEIYQVHQMIVSSAQSAPDSHTLELTRSSQLDVCGSKKPHTQKKQNLKTQNKPKNVNFKPLAIELSKTLCRNLPTAHFCNDRAESIVETLFENGCSRSQILGIIDDIGFYRFLRSRHPSDILPQLIAWNEEKFRQAI